MPSSESTDPPIPPSPPSTEGGSGPPTRGDQTIAYVRPPSPPPPLPEQRLEPVAEDSPIPVGIPLSATPTLLSPPPGPSAPPSPTSSRRSSFDYELLGEVAAGGMGVVYRARQVSLNRIVALKMIRTGQFASALERRRFFAEAETAALLDHPNIVPIYEVGELSGQPFLSMKFIDGGCLSRAIPTLFADPQRLATTIGQVARAVHHAHQHGILHRDLKPANILLDREGAPHVTDFGLAKRIDGENALTHSGAMVGTPSYMAPEQANGGRLTVAADVYGLGAILYECITSRPPFVGTTLYDTVIMVRSAEPVAPSRLRGTVPRDLETICLKALEKDPKRRYATAAELAEDLEHFVADEPIRARPVGTAERLYKWARRRPAQAGLVAVSLAAVIVVIGLFLWSYVRIDRALDEARQQQQRAERRSRQARHAADRMYTQVAVNWLLDEPSKDALQREFLEEALALYEELAQDMGHDPEGLEQTGRALFHMGGILRLLGQTKASEEAYLRAIALQRERKAALPEEESPLRSLAETYNWLGELYREGGRRLADAQEAYHSAHNLQAALVARSGRAEDRRDLARTHYNLGIVAMDTGRTDSARQEYDRAVDLLRGVLAADDRLEDARHNLAQCLINRAVLRRAEKNLDEADTDYREALALLRRLRREAGSRPRYRLDLAVNLNNHGNLLAEAGRPDDALAARQEALTLGKELVVDFPKRPKHRKELANIHNSLAVALLGRGDRAGARRHWQDALDLDEALVREQPDYPDVLGQRGITRGNLGWLATAEQKWAEARPLLELAVKDLKEALALNADHPGRIAHLRQHLQTLTETLLQLGDYTAAATRAGELAEVGGGSDPLTVYYASCFLARCSAQAAKDARREEAERLAGLSLQKLRHAIDQGLQDSEPLRKDRPGIFGELANRPEFHHLFQKLPMARPRAD